MKTRKSILTLTLTTALMFSLIGCSKTNETVNNSVENTSVVNNNQQTESSSSANNQQTETSDSTSNPSSSSSTVSIDECFTNRDLLQEANLTEAKYLTVTDGQSVTISEAGVYVLTGNAKEAQILVEANEEDKVQLVLDSLTITNTSAPAIYVKSADKVFVTTSADSSLTVSGTFKADGDTNLDAVIFSKEDLVLNGTATLTIKSSSNGVTSKDDLKVTGGTYVINASSHGLEGKDSIQIADGNFTITAGTDGLHSANSDDNTLGYIYIFDGSFTINAQSDGIEAQTVLMIENGTFSISGEEGLEATNVVVNGGDITINASDDGINGSANTTALTIKVEINGGNITIKMDNGDTNAIDSNGNLIITGGKINITAQSAFDYDGSVTFTGGEVYVNGSQVTSINNSMMMGPGGRGQMGQNGSSFQGGGQMPGGRGRR